MMFLCPTCARLNPEEAIYCHFDGVLLAGGRGDGPVDAARQLFATAFVGPGGRVCRSFDELALFCDQEWETARELLQQGYLASFLEGLGRPDLAGTARQAAAASDVDEGLDWFLGCLPTHVLEPARLVVEPTEIHLGQLTVGQDRLVELHLRNVGMRLVTGAVLPDPAGWLAPADAMAGQAKVFRFHGEQVVLVAVRGKLLRAGSRLLEGRLVVRSEAGEATVVVRAEVPVVAFAEGVLTGARTPRQLAEKAKAAPREAALLFENGAVARWYAANGWSFPVAAPVAAGLGAVQQFFEALGLTRPPRVTIDEPEIELRGKPGRRLNYMIEIRADDNRPVFGHASSDSDWLKVGPPELTGRTGRIPLLVEAVPKGFGRSMTAHVTIIANGQQRFVVPVRLAVVRRRTKKRDKGSETGRVLSVVPMGRLTVLMHFLLPLVLLSLLGGLFAADLHQPPPPPPTPITAATQPPVKSDDLSDPNPRLGLLFHDRPDALLPEPTMSFGLVLLRHKDPERPGRLKRLTFDELGRSNNTCLRVDGAEQLFGHSPGRWRTMARALGSDNQGRERQGLRSIWEWPGPHIAVTQRVEIVAGEQSRLLDTCRVSYTIRNEDDRPHNVGLRFLLDTFIGANDGVPFHVPGINRLIATSRRFDDPASVPAFIEALEHDRLDSPGTVAHLQLRLGNRWESPTRVTLGSWPDPALAQRPGGQKARGQLTGWDVPVLSMHALPQADSAVTLYWDERPLLPGDRRVVGFTYGLIGIASSEGKGELAATVGGSFRPGGQFIVTAYVSNPAPGQTLSLALPEDFSLVDGAVEQRVPPVPAGASRRQSVVVWTVQAPNQEGSYRLRVVSSTGVSQTINVTVRERRLFD